MLSSWIKKFLPKAPGTIRRPLGGRKIKRAFQLDFLNLEDRSIPAFLAPTSFNAGPVPGGIAIGDFNGDAKSDMAVISQQTALTPASIGIFTSNGDGTFASGASYPVAASAFDTLAGDFNGDGKLDLAIADSVGNIELLFGAGDATFTSGGSYPVAPGVHGIKAGDFNNDGNLDLATNNFATASILVGNGDGTFRTHYEVTLGGNTNMIVGDFDHDGNLDLASSNTMSVGNIVLAKGHGDGFFSPPVNVYAFSAPVYVADGDFNHDGFDDFAVANSYAATSMSVILNNGDGTYQQPVTYAIPETGYEIEVADLNNDGFQDFAVRGVNLYMVEYGRGDGSFYASLNFPTPMGQFEKGSVHGDFNGDGAIDLAYVSGEGLTVVMNANDSTTSLGSAVAFQVSTPATSTSGSAMPMTITALDANGNVATGFLGTVFVTSSDPAVKGTFTYTFNAADAGVHTFAGSVKLVTLGQQTVTVSSPLMQPSTSTVTVTPAVSKFAFNAPAGINAGDSFTFTVTAIDQLGAVGTSYTSTIHFTSADFLAGLPADYTFTAADAGVHTFTATLKTAGSIFLGASEVNGSAAGGTSVNVSPLAAVDLTLAGAGGAIGVARPVTVVARDPYGNIDTSYTGTVHFTSSDPLAVLPADTTLVNGVANANVTFLTVGTQTVTATDLTTGLTGTMSSDATPPVAALFKVTGYPASTAGDSQSFTVTVVDTIGQTATGYSGTIYFSSSDVQASLPASYTFTAADAGVHTFSGTFRTAGLQTLAATDLSGVLRGSQAGIDVSPAAFSGFSLVVPIPTDSHGHRLMTAGDVIPVMVKASDMYGNAVPGYSGTVHVSSTDAGAILPADYTFNPVDGGLHTFSVQLTTATAAGIVWSINVVDNVDPTTLVTVTNFEVVNSVAASFGITLPTQITAGTSFSSKVTVTDAYGNGVKNYFGTVHFSTTSTLAGLPADYTFNGDDAGAHTFTVALNTSGGQSLSVVDLNSGLSASVSGTVKAAAVSALTISTAASTNAGTAQNVTVAAVDAYGNVATDFRGTVTFSSSDAQAVLPAKYTFSNKDAGVHVFSTTLKTAGTQSITVLDAADGLSAIASGIQVSAVAVPGAAVRFLISAPTSVTQGVGFKFTVTVVDAYGNIVTGYTGKVQITSTDAKGGTSTYTFSKSDNGVHTFSYTFNTLGSQTLNVFDTTNNTILGSAVVSVASKK